MKIRITLGFSILLLFLSLTLISAKVDYKESLTITKYYEDDVVITKNIYAGYDNDERYSTYDYRHGYSYRTSIEYWKDHHNNLDKYRDYDKRTRDREYYDYSNYDKYGNDYYLSYTPYLRQSERHNCSPNPKKNQLFYIRCPY